MNSSLRKVIKSQQIFPTDDAAFKLVYLAMRNISKKWTMPIKEWKPALNRFAIEFEGRLCT
jgi:putative transposase